MNAKHTPGPWTRNRAINTVDMGRYSVICPFGADSKKHVSEIEANMRIISAAPDLLAALESMIAKIDADKLPISCSLARAAIAKAKGE
jgi:hypothetical protein